MLLSIECHCRSRGFCNIVSVMDIVVVVDIVFVADVAVMDVVGLVVVVVENSKTGAYRNRKFRYQQLPLPLS